MPGVYQDKPYIPKTKQELLNWVKMYCFRNGKPTAGLNKMRKSQLYAIFFNINRKKGD